MKKRIVASLMAILMVAVLALTGCGSNANNESAANNKANGTTNESQDASKAEPVEVEFWTMQLSPTFDDYLNGVIAGFEKENTDIKVKWVDIPWGDMEKKILATAATGSMPDVVNLNPEFSQKLAQLGALADMEVHASDVKGDYFTGSWNASQFEGKTFALPWYVTNGITFYNKTLFEEAGLDSSVAPKTYNEVYEMAKTIKEKTGKYGYMTVFSQQYGMEDFEKMGVRLFNDDYTEANFTSPELFEAVNLFKKMMDEDLMPKDSLVEGLGKAIQLYSAGEVAIFQGGTSHAGMIESNNVEVYNNTGVGGQLRNENGKLNIAVMNIAVAESSENKDAAVKFAKYLTNAQNQLDFAKASGAILPSTKDSINDDFFTKGDGTAKGEARISSAGSMTDGQVIFPPIKNWSEVRDAFIVALQKSISGEEAPESAFAEAEKIANEALNR